MYHIFVYAGQSLEACVKKIQGLVTSRSQARKSTERETSLFLGGK